MARAALGWARSELAQRANVGISSVHRSYRELSRSAVLDNITAALVAAGHAIAR